MMKTTTHRIIFADEALWNKCRIEDRSSTELIVLVRGRKGSELYPVLKDTSDIGFDFPPAPSIEWTHNIITKILTTQETIPNKHRYFRGIDLLRAVMFDYVVGVHALLETAGRMAAIIRHFQPERVESIGLNWDVQMLLIKLSRLFGILFCKKNLLYRSVKTMSLITINLTGRPDVMDYAEKGAAFPVREPDELTSAIRRIVSGLDQESFIQNMEKYLRISACGADGKAAERFADLVETLI